MHCRILNTPSRNGCASKHVTPIDRACNDRPTRNAITHTRYNTRCRSFHSCLDNRILIEERKVVVVYSCENRIGCRMRQCHDIPIKFAHGARALGNIWAALFPFWLPSSGRLGTCACTVPQFPYRRDNRLHVPSFLPLINSVAPCPVILRVYPKHVGFVSQFRI